MDVRAEMSQRELLTVGLDACGSLPRSAWAATLLWECLQQELQVSQFAQGQSSPAASLLHAAQGGIISAVGTGESASWGIAANRRDEIEMLWSLLDQDEVASVRRAAQRAQAIAFAWSNRR